MSCKAKAAACLLAGCLMIGGFSGAEASRHAAEQNSTTVVNTERTTEAAENTRTAVPAGLRGEAQAAAERAAVRHTPASWEQAPQRPADQVMRLWNVEATDTGGTLLFSDSPEYVKSDGITYTDTVEGSARVLFYHLNDTSDLKKVAVVLENTTGGFTTVQVTRGGMSEPSSSYLTVGKQTQMEYFNTKMDESVFLFSHGRRLLRPEMGTMILQPGQLVYGVFDFKTEVPVKVYIIMYPADADPLEFVKTAVILPKDEERLRGTFKGMDRILRSQKVYNPEEDGVVYFPIGDNERDPYRRGIDATDGSQVVDYGNYGVLYHIQIPTVSSYATQYYLSPLGGVYAGAMKVALKGDSAASLLLTPRDRTYFGDATPPESIEQMQTRENGTAVLSPKAELADLGTYDGETAPSFEYSPPGASNLPVNIILMPANEPLAPKTKRG